MARCRPANSPPFNERHVPGFSRGANADNCGAYRSPPIRPAFISPQVNVFKEQ